MNTPRSDGHEDPAARPMTSEATVRSVSLAGQKVILECGQDGTVLVNGDEVEPTAFTAQRFRDGS